MKSGTTRSASEHSDCTIEPSDACKQSNTDQQNFFAQNPSAQTVISLFDFLPSVYFYAKDIHHRYIGINQPTLRDIFGLQNKEQILGRTDREFQPPALAEAYHAEDVRVMQGRVAIPNQVWLVPHVRGTPRWYVSTKTPLFNPENEVIGIAGVMYSMESPSEQKVYFRELAPVIKYIDDNYHQQISMKKMAAMVNLSSTHFNQRFRALLRLSPTEYVLSRRVQHARNLLSETTQTLTEIAIASGFYDQSHFAKRFRRVTGLTPNAYRSQFLKS